MKIDQLECFLKLSETLSFSETAVFLGLTQPSVTRRIQALESSLGSTLFIRNKHSVKLTPQGIDLLKRAKPLYLELGSLMSHSLDSQQKISGPLRIGVLPGIGKSFFFPYFMEFQSLYPEVQFQVDYSLNHMSMAALSEGKLDFVIQNQMPESELYRSYKIVQEKAVMVTRAQNPLLKRNLSTHKLSAYEVSELPFLGYSTLDGLLNLFLKSFYRPLDLSKIEKISCVNDHGSMIQNLLSTNNFAVMPWFTVKDSIQSGELVQVGAEEKSNTYYLVEMNKSYRSKKEQAFRTFLIEKTNSRKTKSLPQSSLDK